MLTKRIQRPDQSTLACRSVYHVSGAESINCCHSASRRYFSRCRIHLATFYKTCKTFPERRKFLSLTALGLGAALSYSFFDGMVWGKYRYFVRNIKVKSRIFLKVLKAIKSCKSQMYTAVVFRSC